MNIRLRKDAEHLWKTLFISQEKGTLPWGDVVSSCLSGLSVSPKTRKTWKDEPTVFLMQVAQAVDAIEVWSEIFKMHPGSGPLKSVCAF